MGENSGPTVSQATGMEAITIKSNKYNNQEEK
jgi:hypothetical protein